MRRGAVAASAALVLCGSVGVVAWQTATTRILHGRVNPVVTQATIGDTICRRGWTATVRPDVEYTQAVKRRMAAEAGVDVRSVILDHIVPLEVGGAPADPRNFMLQPRAESLVKDRAEDEVRRRVCAGSMSLRAGQRCFRLDWRSCPTG